MTRDPVEDVPSPIDLRSRRDAREWAAPAMIRRPWREQFFQRFIVELRNRERMRVLELGSGPGFLAQRILEAIPGVEYTLLDFSPAMHELARERLGPLMQRARPVLADFKCDGWNKELGVFDAVITNQAVHELRHKRHVLKLHQTVRSLLKAHGCYLAATIISARTA